MSNRGSALRMRQKIKGNKEQIENIGEILLTLSKQLACISDARSLDQVHQLASEGIVFV